jgi:cation diffusion facilitator CzcD-associated flavoprotein CzcO
MKPLDALRLDVLERRLKQDLAWLEFPGKDWVPQRRVDGALVRDVVIVGAGMAGLAASGLLKRYGVLNHIVYDRAPTGSEGPWTTYARMRTLRSPKQLTGPAIGLPALTFRAYYEARFGLAAWEALGKIPRLLWMEYLIWFRRMLELPIVNEAVVTTVHARPDGLLSIAVEHAGRTETVLARRLVLATGRDGLGGPYVPPFAEKIDRRFWAHSADDIDFTVLAGKRVGVVGAGASAMDNAATALEAGAARVDLFIRRGDIPRINKFTGIGSAGVVHGFAGLPDEWKWRFLDYVMSAQTPPPHDSVKRVSQHANAFFHLGSPVQDLEEVGGRLRVTTPRGTADVDHMIFATGFRIDLASRPELADFADCIRLWGDRFVPPADWGLNGSADGELYGSPDLGDSFEFLEKLPGICPALKHIHCFNFPATLSHGKLTGDIPAISEGADRLARGVVRSLFVEDRAVHFENLQAYTTPEITGDEWQDAEMPGPEKGSESHAAE